MRDVIRDSHPLVEFLFFFLVLGISMFLVNPLCMVFSLICASFYCRRLGRKGFFLLSGFLALAAVLNPLFIHEGATILLYFPDGNPLTLESILYGANSALMLAALISWFGCMTAVLTADRFVYLFGRIAPALSLFLSMTLRFVPRFREQMQKTAEAHAASGAPKTGKLRSAMEVFSATVTWALENSVETSDSMKSRGYGLPGRTAYTTFRFGRRDSILLAAFLILGTGTILCMAAGALNVQFYPTVVFSVSGLTWVGALCYALLCAAPVILDLWEDFQWNLLQSKI